MEAGSVWRPASSPMRQSWACFNLGPDPNTQVYYLVGLVSCRHCGDLFFFPPKRRLGGRLAFALGDNEFAGELLGYDARRANTTHFRVSRCSPAPRRRLFWRSRTRKSAHSVFFSGVAPTHKNKKKEQTLKTNPKDLGLRVIPTFRPAAPVWFFGPVRRFGRV